MPRIKKGEIQQNSEVPQIDYTKYKYKSGAVAQMFRKRLPFDQEIVKNVYDGKITMAQFVQDFLYTMVPPSCLRDPRDRNFIASMGVNVAVALFGKNKDVYIKLKNKEPLTLEEYFQVYDHIKGLSLAQVLQQTDKALVEKFGVSELKRIDLSVLEKGTLLKTKMLECSGDIQTAFYNVVKDCLAPKEWPAEMKAKKEYAKFFFSDKEIKSASSEREGRVMQAFNEISPLVSGFSFFSNWVSLSLKEILFCWNSFSGKEIDAAIQESLRDKNISPRISVVNVKNFVKKYPNLIRFVGARSDYAQIISILGASEQVQASEKGYIKNLIEPFISDPLYANVEVDAIKTEDELVAIVGDVAKMYDAKDYVSNCVQRAGSKINPASYIEEALEGKTVADILPKSLVAEGSYSAYRFISFFGLENIRELLLASEKHTELFEQMWHQLQSIQSPGMKQAFCNYVKQNLETLTEAKILNFIQAFNMAQYSNSSQMQRVSSNLMDQVVNSEVEEADLVDTMHRVETIFLDNAVPEAGKRFAVYSALHQNWTEEDWTNKNVASVVLTEIGPIAGKVGKKGFRDSVILSDLLAVAIKSNNWSMREYLMQTKAGADLYGKLVKAGSISKDDFEKLEESDKALLISLRDKLLLALRTRNKESTVANLVVEVPASDDILGDIQKITQTLSRGKEKTPEELIVRNVMMLSPYKVKSFSAAIQLMDDSAQMAHQRNVARAHELMEQGDNGEPKSVSLNQGDLFKFVNSKYIGSILANGSLAKEYLGASADADYTQFDTDLYCNEQKGQTPVSEIFTSGSGYGDVAVILRNAPSRFCVTSVNPKSDTLKVTGSHKDKSEPATEEDETREELNYSKRVYDPRKMELCYCGIDNPPGRSHYAIRTGFPSSEIDYIVNVGDNREKLEKIKLEIALAGFYIPVLDSKGVLVFTPDEYNKIREKMSGIERYGATEFKFSDNLGNKTSQSQGDKEIQKIASEIEKSSEESAKKRKLIVDFVSEVMESDEMQELLGTETPKVTTQKPATFRQGVAEMIDTGSTGRNTNMPGDGDFDFMLKLDRFIIADENKRGKMVEIFDNALKPHATSKTSKVESVTTGKGGIRSTGIELLDEHGQKVVVDIDITLENRTADVFFSSDESLKARLAQIQKQDPEKYKLVLANIVRAKQVLKAGGVYKAHKSGNALGGFGGIGVENWVLQHGGSFLDAAKSFIEASQGVDFEKFIQLYHIWDFGFNHLREDSHDDFCGGKNQLTEAGYKKLQQVLAEYVASAEREANPQTGKTSGHKKKTEAGEIVDSES